MGFGQNHLLLVPNHGLLFPSVLAIQKLQVGVAQPVTSIGDNSPRNPSMSALPVHDSFSVV
jgi:hypothetical protein